MSYLLCELCRGNHKSTTLNWGCSCPSKDARAAAILSWYTYILWTINERFPASTPLLHHKSMFQMFILQQISQEWSRTCKLTFRAFRFEGNNYFKLKCGINEFWVADETLWHLSEIWDKFCQHKKYKIAVILFISTNFSHPLFLL